MYTHRRTIFIDKVHSVLGDFNRFALSSSAEADSNKRLLTRGKTAMLSQLQGVFIITFSFAAVCLPISHVFVARGRKTRSDSTKTKRQCREDQTRTCFFARTSMWEIPRFEALLTFRWQNLAKKDVVLLDHSMK